MALFTAVGTAMGVTAAVTAATGVTAFGAGVATVGAVTALGVGAYAMSQSGDKGKDGMQQAQMPNAPAAPTMADASKIAQQTATDKRRNAARSESVKTNPLGIKDEATVARKKLTGS